LAMLRINDVYAFLTALALPGMAENAAARGDRESGRNPAAEARRESQRRPGSFPADWTCWPFSMPSSAGPRGGQCARGTLAPARARTERCRRRDV